MNEQEVKLDQFDDWLKEGSDVAAVVMRQWLEPVEGKDAVIFPATYAKPEDWPRDKEWPGYNIDRLPDGSGSSICQIDSVGSQANRMEPIFKSEKYKHLVPQVMIKAGDREINLLDAGHRAGDAIARFSGKIEGASSKDGKALAEQLWNAFKAWQDNGNAEALARIAPTSLVFGAWDSRATQAKIPRIVRSVIRAYDVERLTRSAQFNTPLHYVDEGLIDESLDKGEGEKNPLSQEGFRHNPAPGAHGGVLVKGDIRRDASINLVALRALSPRSQNDEERLGLLRYILGLVLIAVTSGNEGQFNLREGCLLRVVNSSSWQEVPFEGEKRNVAINPKAAQDFAEEAAKHFRVIQLDKPFIFDSKTAGQWLKLKKEDRDKRRRRGPVINQELP